MEALESVTSAYLGWDLSCALLDKLHDELLEAVVAEAFPMRGCLDPLDVIALKSDQAALRHVSFLCKRIHAAVSALHSRQVIIDRVTAPQKALAMLKAKDELGLVRDIVIDAETIELELKDARAMLAHPQNLVGERYRKSAPVRDWIDSSDDEDVPPRVKEKRNRMKAFELARRADERISELKAEYIEGLIELIGACTQLRCLAGTDGWTIPLHRSGLLPRSCSYVSIGRGRPAQLYDVIDSYPNLRGIALHQPYQLSNHVFFEDSAMVAEAATHSQLSHLRLGVFDHFTKTFLDQEPCLTSLDLTLVWGKKGWRDAIVDILESISRLNLIDLTFREVPTGGRALGASKPSHSLTRSGWVMRLLPKSLRRLEISFAEAATSTYPFAVHKARLLLETISNGFEEATRVCHHFSTLIINLPTYLNDPRAQHTLAGEMRRLQLEATSQYALTVIYRYTKCHPVVPMPRRLTARDDDL